MFSSSFSSFLDVLDHLFFAFANERGKFEPHGNQTLAQGRSFLLRLIVMDQTEQSKRHSSSESPFGESPLMLEIRYQIIM